jgi:Flp pilus assembly protein TadG
MTMLAQKRPTNRGSVATMIALAMPAIMGFAAMAVDWGQVSVARIGVKAAADSAALAAADALKTKPTTTAQISAAQTQANSLASAYASRFKVNGLTVTSSAVSFGYYDSSTSTFTTSVSWPNAGGKYPNAVQVTGTATVNMTFSRLMKMNAVTVNWTSRAGSGVVPGRAPDLVIAQDVTPSMSNSDIASAKAANTALVNCIKTNSDPSTRGAFVKFSNVDKVVQPLVSYTDSPYGLLNAANGTTAGSYTNSDVCLGPFNIGCTSHSSGYQSAINILNLATAPPEDVGQAIIFVTDGATDANDQACKSAVTGAGGTQTPYQAWLAAQCVPINAATTEVACESLGARWNTTSRCSKNSTSYTTASQCTSQGGVWGPSACSKFGYYNSSSCTSNGGKWTQCEASDNGAENTNNSVDGTCSSGGWSTEARCEGNGGQWRRVGTTTYNPSSYVRWTEQSKAMAAAGTHGPIDVYAIFYSNGASSTYKNDNIKFMQNHIIRGKGAELGVLDAPTGAALTAALQDVCIAYTVGSAGLIE